MKMPNELKWTFLPMFSRIIIFVVNRQHTYQITISNYISVYKFCYGLFLCYQATMMRFPLIGMVIKSMPRTIKTDTRNVHGKAMVFRTIALKYHNLKVKYKEGL